MQLALQPLCICTSSPRSKGALLQPPLHSAATCSRNAISSYNARNKRLSPAIVPWLLYKRNRDLFKLHWAKEQQQEAQPGVGDPLVMGSNASCRAPGFMADDADATASEHLASTPQVAVRGRACASISSASHCQTSNDHQKRIKQQQRLLRQLLNSSSVSSMSSMDAAESECTPPLPALQQQQRRQPANSTHLANGTHHDATVLNQTAAAAKDVQRADFSNTSSSDSNQHAQRRRMPQGLYDDDSAADYDPIMLDLLGFTSVAQYLQYKLDTAVKQAKVDCIAAATWAGLAYVVLTNMGGHAAYMTHFRELTANGSASDNLMFLWVYILGYFTVKGCVMSLATGWRAMTERQAEPEKVQELEQLQTQDQRLAFWQLQERLDKLDNRANRTFTEFALASTLLGVLIFMRGGLDNLLLQMDTVDQKALGSLIVMMWLFWESYFTGIGAMVQLAQVATNFVEKWQHKTKWEKDVDRE